jgi:hypothetical protein
MLELKTANVPTLIGTGAQVSCIRSAVAELLYPSGELYIFRRIRWCFFLAKGHSCELTDAVKRNMILGTASLK